MAVTAAAGLIVGLLHRLLRVPEQTPGIIAEISTGQAVSLIGGASLGPEKALGSMGGGAATWIARRRAVGTEDSQVSVLSGMVGAYGGMLSSPVIVVMLFLEVARPGGGCCRRFLCYRQLPGRARAALPRQVQVGSPGCCKISTIERISSTEPNATNPYRTPFSLNELPMPTRNSIAARNTVIRT